MAGGTLVSAVTSDRVTIANLFIGLTFPLQRPASNTARKDAAAL
ncbi:hypothetical protein ACVJBD_001344 [Rhizobium mongolense]